MVPYMLINATLLFVDAMRLYVIACDRHETKCSNAHLENKHACPLDSNINTDVRNAQLLHKENSSMDVTLFTYIPHKLPYIHRRIMRQNEQKGHIGTADNLEKKEFAWL